MISRGFLKQWTRTVMAPKSTLKLRTFSSAVDALMNPANGLKEIIVKNIPFTTQEECVRDLFDSCGTITNIDIPTYPDGRGVGSCVVSFTTSEAATAALAHDGLDFNGRWMKVKLNGQYERQDHVKPQGCRQIFIGNLHYGTDEESVQEVFGNCGEIISVRLAQDHETGKFRGFGHVEFADTASVDEAMNLNGADICGRSVRISYARARQPRTGGEYGEKHGGKVPNQSGHQVFIGNLPYETDTESVRNVFERCGKIISIRLANDRETGQFRGFAHVEFAESGSADEAVGLTGANICGRSVRVSYARERVNEAAGHHGRGNDGRGNARKNDYGRGRDSYNNRYDDDDEY